jgi:hypothetical protein
VSHRSRHFFVAVSLPDRFILEVPDGDGWIDHGRYEASAFQRQEDGSYLCAGPWGSPTYVRVARQHRDQLDVVGNDGSASTFRIVPLPSDAYPEW